jgi:hypothetical protein
VQQPLSEALVHAVDHGEVLGGPSPNPSWPVVGPRGSSTSASGFPRASARRTLSTAGSTGPRMADLRGTRASSSVSLLTCISRQRPKRVLAGIPGREDEQHRLGEQPPGDEVEGVCESLIEPLRVIDQAHQRPLLDDLGQETKNRQPDQETVGRLSLSQGERGPQPIALGPGRQLSRWRNGPQSPRLRPTRRTASSRWLRERRSARRWRRGRLGRSAPAPRSKADDIELRSFSRTSGEDLEIEPRCCSTAASAPVADDVSSTSASQAGFPDRQRRLEQANRRDGRRVVTDNDLRRPDGATAGRTTSRR